MSSGNWRIAVLALLALAGCTGSRPATPPDGTASGQPSAVLPVNLTVTPQQYAASHAAAMLRAFTPPPGARQVSASPSAALDFVESSTTDVDRNLADQFTEWVVPGKPASVLALAAAHRPACYALIGSGTSGSGPHHAPVLDDVFQLPPVPPVLNLRELDVSVVAVADDAKGRPRTGIRVDALAGWVTAGPSYQWIPAAARVMTLTEVPPVLKPNPVSGLGPALAPATIGNARQVRDIASLINGMALLPAGAVYNCPMDYGGHFALTFAAQGGAPALATVTLPMSGCAFTSVAVNGKPERDLLPADGATDVLARIERITGLNWPALRR